MASLLDGIFIEPLDECVMININILIFVEMTIEFVVRDTILDLRWIELSSTTPLSSFQHMIDHVLVIPWTPCYSCNCSLSISCDLQLQPLLGTPCWCYLEAWLRYSGYQQEHWKHLVECFLIYYPNTIVWVISWFFPRPPYLNAFELAVISCISCSASPWEGYTPNSGV